MQRRHRIQASDQGARAPHAGHRTRGGSGTATGSGVTEIGCSDTSGAGWTSIATYDGDYNFSRLGLFLKSDNGGGAAQYSYQKTAATAVPVVVLCTRFVMITVATSAQMPPTSPPTIGITAPIRPGACA